MDLINNDELDAQNRDALQSCAVADLGEPHPDARPEPAETPTVGGPHRGRPRKDKPARRPYVRLLPEEMARELVICRIVEAEEAEGADIRSVRKFAEDMFKIGVTRSQLSVATLYRLFAGEMYPKLTDRDGVPFDWSLIPRAKRGRRPGRSSQTSRLGRIEQQLKRLTSVVAHICHKLDLRHDLTKDPAFAE
jgi:hypothetical protein